MGTSSLRSLLLAAIVLSNCITWTASRHHYTHNVNGHRSRHRRQGAGLFLPASYVIPGGEGSGAWGEWGEISPCSRTCGGGVASQKRICLEFGSDGRPRCTGGDTKYFSCQTHDCPEGAGDFRAEQCAEFNDKMFRDQKIYSWVPYTKGHNPCELNCMPRGERFYYRQREAVVDGTRCNDESFDVCVNGTCQAVGCDMMLGSNAREDKCRECRGNGTNCKTMEGLIPFDPEVKRGYVDVMLIPQGATNIIIEEIKASNNYLALRAKERRRYYLNGDYHIDFPRSLVIAGALWHYERNQMGFAAPDRLRCVGPINEPLYLSLLLQEDNVGVKYEYSIPTDLVPRSAMKYDWTFDKFTPCSATCGGGFQMRTVTCRSRDDLAQVDESLCEAQLKPATNQTCNTQACAPRWVEGPWSPCSKPCGEGGTRSREIHCEKIITNGFPSIVSDKECVELLGAKPNLYEECNQNATCPTWFVGPWKPCDKLCGQGVQKRQVVCYTRVNGRVAVFDDNECADEKPPSEQACNLHPCTGIDYVLSDWSGCDSCLSTKRTRLAKCVTKDNVVVDYSMCAYHPAPILEEPCDKSQLPPCEVQWYATQWSNCSVECGVGIKTRRVFCGMVNGDAVEEVEDGRCDPELKYRDTKPCEVPKENCPAKWFAGPWSECTKKCGGGEQYRHVTCLIGDKVVLSCATTDIPDTLQTCNMRPCNEDEVIPLDSSSTPIMDDDVYYDYQDCDEDYKQEVGAEESEMPDSTLFPPEDYDIKEPVNESGSGMTELTTDGEFTSEGSGFGSTFESTSTSETSESSSVTSSDVTDLITGISTTTVSSGSDNTESAAVDISNSTETSNTETDSTETGSTEIDSTETSYTETGSTETSNTETTETVITETSNTETGSTETSNTEPVSTETSNTVGSTETSNPETGSTETSNTETVTTETSNTETGSTETSDKETGSTETSNTETVTTETSNTETGSTETSNKETGSTETTNAETGSTETSNTETGSTETGSTETDSTDTGSTETDSTENSTTDSTETGSTQFTESSYTTDATETKSTEFTSTIDNISTTSDSKSTEESTVSSDKDISTTESSTTNLFSTQTTEETGSSTTEEVSDSTIYSTTESISESSTTGSDESSTVETSVTTESEVSTSDEPEETSTTQVSSTGTMESTSESSEASTASETVSEVSTLSSSDIRESTEFSTTTSDEDTESTPTGVTETTIDLSSTTELMGLTTGFSTKTDWGTTMKEFTSPRRCVSKKVAKCLRSLYGCCPDKKTPAKGPFDEGCPNPKTCETTKFKCCSDGVSPAAGPNNKGCPVINCTETLYGCCLSDNTTPAEGNDQEGCPKPVPACEKSKYGCCVDGETEAKGLDKQGCPETQTEISETTTQGSFTTTIITTTSEADNETGTTPPGESGSDVPCNMTQFGCCPDGVTPAAGAQMEGCLMTCNTSLYGCCPDGQTPAHGSEYEGCCLQTAYGCCPDNYKPADGPNLEGCGCQYARYGCCPDNSTIARGSNNEGCGCQYTQFGCCPDSHTEAQGPEFAGCDCNTYQFGCCPDGYTAAVGPNLQGCHCQQSDYGCCGDGQTAAKGPDQLGCDCSSSKYGCCPDGVTEAKGEKFLDCTDVPENRQAACSLPNDRGSCRNFTVNWFYDTMYGGCSRFWYGGCDGNGNRFTSQDECEDVCVQPAPKDACKLPSVRGSCTNPTIRWYYDSSREQCLQFEYGGCLGNANNFESSDLCQKQCEPARSEDQCTLPIERGSCAGNFDRWGYNSEVGRCEQFVWGGCEGNENRFSSEAACLHRCSPPGMPKPECSLPQQSGDCTEKFALWAFRADKNRCVPFYYTGCGGNDNRFESEDECARACPSSYEKDTCVLPAVTGQCGNYTLRWFFDTKDKRCRQFYYGGCDGNENNFLSEDQCESRCLPRATTPAPPASPPTVDSKFCFLELDPGPCDQFATRWAYEPTRGGCVPFEYGGCGGNTNNFDTLETCEAYCSQIQDVCQLPQLRGPCEDWSVQWFYDATVDTCKQFYYGGCDGNGNRFASQEACEQRCQRQEPATRPTTRPATRPTEPFTTAATITTTAVAVTTTTTTTPKTPSRTASGTDPCKQPRESGNCVGYNVLWYYDEVRDACGQFVYTGCDGNDNRFESQAECEDRCILRIAVKPQTAPASIAAVTTTTYVPPVQTEREACRTPISLDPCGENITTYYYDTQAGACLSGFFGACGYANSYSSEEECERQCGAFRNIDVCRATLDPGPCFYSVNKVYWDVASGRCLSFTYGGCLGGPNRFSSVEECEDVCGRRGPEPACLHPVDSGRRCGVSTPRWWYDVSVADCRAFVFLGCDGNDNNFPSYDECAARCRPDFIDNEVVPNCDRFEEYCDQLRCEGLVIRSTGPDGCVRCTCAAPAPAPAPGDCEPARRACAALTCAIIERVIGPDGCEMCQCTNPCANTECQEGERCVFEPYASSITSEVTYLAECRPMNKSGWCPRMAANGTECERLCNDDADCRGVGKCCPRGCQYSCVSPLPTTLPPTVPTTTYTPDLPRAPVASSETQPEVSAAEGGTATLRCLFHGNPPPSITWRRGEITIESDRERYRLLSDGALEIVSIYRSDAGVYICIGSNQLGSVTKEVRLNVNDPVEGPAGIAGAARAVVRGRLGHPLHMRCLAYGYPVPSIYWYHGREGPMVPYSNELYEARGNILQIRSLIPEALGEYICQAYNGIGKAAEWSVLVQLEEAEGTPPTTTETTTELTTTTTPAPQFNYRFSGYTVPVSTRILTDRTTVDAGSEVNIRCDVNGYPLPDVYWTKDSVRLLPTDRITPTEARLTISNANINDSGEYGCHASNAFSSHSALVRITVQGVYIPAKCSDNPYFANCSLIVRSRFCNHPYYSRFCCKSCVEAGQLDPQDASIQADQPWRKK